MKMRTSTLGALLGLWVAAVILFFSRHTENANLIKELIGWSGLAFLWTLAVWTNAKQVSRFSSHERIIILLAAWILFSAGAAAASPDKLRAIVFLGRRLGFAATAAYCLYALRGARGVWRMMRIALAACSLASLYVLLQAAGWDFVPWINTTRPLGTFLNPNFTAEFLAAFFPLALIWEMPRMGRSLPWRSALIGAAVVATGSRAGMVGLLAGGFFLCIAGIGVLKIMGRGRRVLIIISVLLMFIAFGALAPSVGRRLFTRATISVRFEIWKASLEFWRERPLLGWGLGSFRLLEERIKYRTEPQTGDRYAVYPHNWALNILVDQGIVGLVIFSALMAAILWRIISNGRILLRERLPHSRFAGMTALGCAAGMIALLTSTLFCILLERWEGGWLLWLLLGAGLSCVEGANGVKLPPRNFSRFAKIFTLALFIAIAAASMIYFRSETLFWRAKQEALQHDGRSALPLAEQAARLIIHNPAVHFLKADALLQTGNADAALKAWQTWAKRSFVYSDGWVLLGFIKKEQGETRQARAHLERAWQMEPSGDKAVAFARFLALTGAGDDALKVLEKQMEIFPYMPAVEEYAEQAARAGRAAEALAHLETMEKKRADFPQEGFRSNYLGVKGHLLYSMGRYEASVKAYLQAAQHAPQNAALWNGLAVSLMRMEKKDEAARAFRRAVRLDPQNPRYLFNSIEAAAKRGDWLWVRRHLPRLDAASLPPPQRARIESIKAEMTK